MNNNYTRGIAFIMEGSTEKVFYKEYLRWIAKDNEYCQFLKNEDMDDGEISFTWINENEKILIKFYVVGAVTQLVHSGKWFSNACAKKYKIPWSVYLCYDTDSPEKDISKFFQDDWKLLRDNLKRSKANKIIDLAASADIEDVMLTDVQGVCNFLEIDIQNEIKGRKGKAKMKALYRSCGRTYHEGDRSVDMIRILNFNKIENEGPIQLSILKNELL